jgi:hypothetical protein
MLWKISIIFLVPIKQYENLPVERFIHILQYVVFLTLYLDSLFSVRTIWKYLLFKLKLLDQ